MAAMAAIFLALVGVKMSLEIARRVGYVKVNYRGKVVSGLLGLVIPWLALGISHLFWIIPIAIVGYVDDRYGKRDCGGLWGHCQRSWQERKPTTGLWKVVVVFMVVYVATPSWSLRLSLLLMTNLFNLVDTRPGRSLKLALFFLLPLGVTAVPIVLAICVLLYFDLKQYGMLGDLGANSLGFWLGWLWLHAGDRLADGSLLFFLIVVQFYAEIGSLSQFIQERPTIQNIDRMGQVDD